MLALGVATDVLIKHFGAEKFSDDKKLSKIEEDLLLLKEIDIQYNISTTKVTLIDQLYLHMIFGETDDLLVLRFISILLFYKNLT